MYVQLPDIFRQECGCSRAEFNELLAHVTPVLHLARDVDGRFTPEENALRRKRRYKYSHIRETAWTLMTPFPRHERGC